MAFEFDPRRSHHTPEGFRNNYPHGTPTRKDLWRWSWERFIHRLPRPPKAPIRGIAPDLAFIQTNRSEIAITWVGHSTLLYQVGGLNILTDAVFAGRASPLSFLGPKRHQPPGVRLKDLPHIDVLVYSHNHYDHLSYPCAKALYRQAGGPPAVFLPLGLDAWFKRHITHGDGTHLVALDWWETANFGELQLTFLPVQHWSQRTPSDRNATLWGAWALRHPAHSFFFSGDLGYSRDVLDIAERFPEGFDLAAIAVGAYEPRNFMRNQHISPAEAVQVFRDLGARAAVGIHWGTFERLTDEPLDQPPEDLAAARETAGIPAEAFFLLRHGETWRPAGA